MEEKKNERMKKKNIEERKESECKKETIKKIK